MIDAEKEAKRLQGVAQALIRQVGHVEPMLVMRFSRTDGESITLAPGFFQNPSDKRHFFSSCGRSAAIQESLESATLKMVSFVDEAWMVESPADSTDKTPPSMCPDRTEIVMVAVLVVAVLTPPELVASMAKIVRTEGKTTMTEFIAIDGEKYEMGIFQPFLRSLYEERREIEKRGALTAITDIEFSDN